MPLECFRCHVFGDTTVRYWRDSEGHVALDLIPTTLFGKTATHRTTLAGLPEIDAIPNAPPPPALSIDPLVHVKIVGDAYNGAFAQGRTMRNGPSALAFTLKSQDLVEDGSLTTIRTMLGARPAFSLSIGFLRIGVIRHFEWKQY